MSAEGSSAGALRTERPRCASASLDVTEESVEFFSPNFDACAVLAAPRVRLPTGFEEVRPLDNLSAARQLIPEIWAASSAPPTGPRHAAARPAATPVAAPAASLVQLPATKKISPNPKDWVCEESGMRENLWLNL